MKICFIGHTAMGGSFVVGSHQLARAAARQGHESIHVSPPVTPAHLVLLKKDPLVRARFERWLRGGRMVDGVREIVPFSILPWQLVRSSKLLRDVYSRLTFASPLQRVHRAGVRDAQCLIVDEPRLEGLATLIGVRPLVYRATDVYALLRKDPRILDSERAICARADYIVATSEPVAAHLRKLSGRAVRVITNGVDFQHFATAAASRAGEALPGERATRAVYVGAFDSRFGKEPLLAAARALPQRHFVLAGPGSKELARESGASNVHGLGPIDYSTVPALLQACAVGMLPLSADAANQGRSPMKLYEYAAAGLTVAASVTDELRRRSLPTLCLAESTQEFPTAVARAFEMASDTALRAAALETARHESWTEKANELFKLSGCLSAAPRVATATVHAEGFQ